MNSIYVTGHRNPDTDSIVAAMAYAALRNARGDWEYRAACLGQVSDETQMVLDRFGFQPPERIYNMYPGSGFSPSPGAEHRRYRGSRMADHAGQGGKPHPAHCQ